MGNKIFGKRLRMLRERRGISQAKLAKIINVSSSAIGLYESGDRNASSEVQQAIADEFNVTIDYLYGRESGSIYYFEPEIAELANEISKNVFRRKVCELSLQIDDEGLKAIIVIMKKIVKK